MGWVQGLRGLDGRRRPEGFRSIRRLREIRVFDSGLCGWRGARERPWGRRWHKEHGPARLGTCRQGLTGSLGKSSCGHVRNVTSLGGGELDYLLPIDLYITVNHELPRLSRAACKQCSEDGGIESSFGRGIDHIHVWCFWIWFAYFIRRRFQTGSSAHCIPCAIFTSKVFVVEFYHGSDGCSKHILPMLLSNGFSMIGSREGFGRPFLLEEGSQCC